MDKYLDFVNELLDENLDVKKEVDLLSLKYDIIRLLANYRKSHNLSQADFAKKIGVKQQMISRFEKGSVDPRLSFISKIITEMNYEIKFSERDYFITTNVIQFKAKSKKAHNINSNYNIIDYKMAK